jgi:hypothetical protein
MKLVIRNNTDKIKCLCKSNIPTVTKQGTNFLTCCMNIEILAVGDVKREQRRMFCHKTVMVTFMLFCHH